MSWCDDSRILWTESNFGWIEFKFNSDKDVWELYPYGYMYSSPAITFKLGEAPKDLRNWMLLAMYAPEGHAVNNLPNWEEYHHARDSTSYTTLEIRKTEPGKLQAYLPRKLLEQIKPIGE